MNARTVAKVVIAALAVLVLVFAREIVLLLFATILLAVMLRALSELVAKYARILPGWRWRSSSFCWRSRSRSSAG